MKIDFLTTNKKDSVIDYQKEQNNFQLHLTEEQHVIDLQADEFLKKINLIHLNSVPFVKMNLSKQVADDNVLKFYHQQFPEKEVVVFELKDLTFEYHYKEFMHLLETIA